MPVQWRALALAAAVMAFNTAMVRALSFAPASGSTPRIALAWCLSELFAYGVHRAMHRVPWLWRFHRMHHAPEPIAWHRSWWIHPLDVALFACAATLACALAGAPLVAAPWLLVLRRVWAILQHANVAWPPTLLDHVLVTPSLHHRHHDEARPAANFAGTFSILDRVFGT